MANRKNSIDMTRKNAAAARRAERVLDEAHNLNCTAEEHLKKAIMALRLAEENLMAEWARRGSGGTWQHRYTASKYGAVADILESGMAAI